MQAICDQETGICHAPILAHAPKSMPASGFPIEVIYVGDPMCSWCWGISPLVSRLQAYCGEQSIPFAILAGGLRPGGGDCWTDAFRAFLRLEWQRIHQHTGQPFGYKLLDRADFNYDTEPACRAIVAARKLLPPDGGKGLTAYFAAVQRKFYVGDGDPTKLEFYRDICVDHGIAFDRFSDAFVDPSTRIDTAEEFHLNRSWGVTGYPSFVLRGGDGVRIIAAGHVRLEALIGSIEAARAVPKRKTIDAANDGVL